MKAVILGRLRINLEHVVWYMPSGKAGGKDHEQPAIALKAVDAEQALTVRYNTVEARDRDLTALDQLFGGVRATEEAGARGQSDPEPSAPSPDAVDRPPPLPAGLGPGAGRGSPAHGNTIVTLSEPGSDT